MQKKGVLLFLGIVCFIAARGFIFNNTTVDPIPEERRVLTAPLFKLSRGIVIKMPQRYVNTTALEQVFGTTIDTLDAITPSDLESIPLMNMYEIVFGRSNSYMAADLGQLAAFESHMAVLDEIAENETILVVEDDVTNSLPIAQLHLASEWIFEHNITFDILRFNAFQGETTDQMISPNLWLQRCKWKCMDPGAVMYIVTYEGAQKLLLMRERGWGLQVDYFFDMVKIFDSGFDMWGIKGLVNLDNGTITQPPCLPCEVPPTITRDPWGVAKAWSGFVWGVVNQLVSQNRVNCKEMYQKVMNVSFNEESL